MEQQYPEPSFVSIGHHLHLHLLLDHAMDFIVEINNYVLTTHSQLTVNKRNSPQNTVALVY
jgi:hypothetical protein